MNKFWLLSIVFVLLICNPRSLASDHILEILDNPANWDIKQEKESILFKPITQKDGYLIMPNFGLLQKTCTAENKTNLTITLQNNNRFQLNNILDLFPQIPIGKSFILNKGEIISKITDNNSNSNCDNSLNEYSKLIYNNKMELNSTPIQILNTDSNCDNLISNHYIIGQTGLEILNLQSCLIEKNYLLPSSINFGYYGINTHRSYLKIRNKTRQFPTISECKDLLNQLYFLKSSGKEIVELQFCLRDLGFYSDHNVITGYYDDTTELAYNNWLYSSNDNCNNLKYGTFYLYEVSQRVKRLQTCFRQEGLNIEPNGLFDINTLKYLNTSI